MNGTRTRKTHLLLWFAAAAMIAMPGLCRAAESPNQLSKEQIADGWIMLFDGETMYGWATKGDCKSKVADGAVVCEGGEGWLVTTTEFRDFLLKLQCRGDAKGMVCWGVPKDGDPSKAANKKEITGKAGEWQDVEIKAEGAGGSIAIPCAPKLEIRNVVLKPLNGKSIFSGKDLTGWKPLPGFKSTFSVTPDGCLNIKNGPGDIQTEDQWKDFCLQLDIMAKNPDAEKRKLNSGVFFRAEPGKFWQGYEAQIRNEFKGDDRTKPVDFGTGAIYNRQAARKVVPNENEWYTMTIIAAGNHLATWVNGYQTTDYTDTNPPGSPRNKQSRTEAGIISLQGHDPTTDMYFKNIRIEAYPEAK
jgi:hypothetical protein